MMKEVEGIAVWIGGSTLGGNGNEALEPGAADQRGDAEHVHLFDRVETEESFLLEKVERNGEHEAELARQRREMGLAPRDDGGAAPEVIEQDGAAAAAADAVDFPQNASRLLDAANDVGE